MRECRNPLADSVALPRVLRGNVSPEIPGSSLASLRSGHAGVPGALGKFDGSCVRAPVYMDIPSH